jgi:hypothetical protein
MFMAILRRGVVVGLAGVSLAAVAAGPASAAKPGRDVTCTGTVQNFGEVTGSVPHNVIVPANQACVITKATVGHDVIMEAGSYVGISSTTIRRDVIGHQVGTLETANFEPNPGPVSVGHNLTLTGIQTNSETANGYTICDTTVHHNLVISGTETPFGTVLGDTGLGPEEFCSGGPDIKSEDTIGGRLTVTGNVFGRLDIGNNTITDNTGTTAFGDLGTLDISDNSVGGNATCANNNPTPTGDGPEDGPNKVAHKNNGC